VAVIGQWFGGLFTTAKGPDTQVQPGAILVVVGVHEANLPTVERMAMPIRRAGPIVLAGYGAVGQKVVEMLLDAGEACTVIDRLAGAGGGCGRQRAGARQSGQSPRARGQRGGAGAQRRQ
jgi:hypothetical protein